MAATPQHTISSSTSVYCSCLLRQQSSPESAAVRESTSQKSPAQPLLCVLPSASPADPISAPKASVPPRAGRANPGTETGTGTAASSRSDNCDCPTRSKSAWRPKYVHTSGVSHITLTCIAQQTECHVHMQHIHARTHVQHVQTHTESLQLHHTFDGSPCGALRRGDSRTSRWTLVRRRRPRAPLCVTGRGRRGSCAPDVTIMCLAPAPPHSRLCVERA